MSKDYAEKIEAICGGRSIHAMTKWLSEQQWDYEITGNLSDLSGSYDLHCQIGPGGPAFPRWDPVYGHWDRDLQEPISDPEQQLAYAIWQIVGDE